MPWVVRMLRGTKVHARARANGTLDVGRDGRVDIKYSPDDKARIYRALARNLEAPVETGPREHDPDAIVVYTDGACSGNPGPMGIGVVILDHGKRREIGEFLGTGTNNIAELTAIERALDEIPERSRGRTVLVHSDSSYAIGLLEKGWKAKANQELVARLRDKARRFPRLSFVKVAGHAGIPENERADRLAVQAITRGSRS